MPAVRAATEGHAGTVTGREEGEEEDDEEPRPQELPPVIEAGVRGWLEQQLLRQAAEKREKGETESSCYHGEQAQQQRPLALLPAAAVRVLQATESSSNREAETAAELEERERLARCHPAGLGAHRQSGPAALVDHRALRLSADDAVRGLYQQQGAEAGAPTVQEHLRSTHSCGSQRHTHLGGRQRSRERAKGSVIVPLQAAQSLQGGNQQDQEQVQAHPPILERVAAKSSGPYMLPAFRNPARVAAALMEATGLLDMRASDGGDGAAFGRLAAAANENGAHHLVAPTLGSAAALQAEIARLESLSFDREAATRAALRERGIDDCVIVETAVSRCRSKALASGSAGADATPASPSQIAGGSVETPSVTILAAPAASGEVIDGAIAGHSSSVPDDPTTGSASSSGDIDAAQLARVKVPLSKGTTLPRPNAAVSRLLARPRRSVSGAAGPASVSAGDILSWQSNLRPHASPSGCTSDADVPTSPFRQQLKQGSLQVQPGKRDTGKPLRVSSPETRVPSDGALEAGQPARHPLIDFAPVLRQSRLPVVPSAGAQQELLLSVR